MKKNPTFWFCDVWQENFWFFIGWKREDFIAWVKKDSGYEPDMNEKATGHTSWITDKHGTRCCIWIKHKQGPKFFEILAHEAVHAANFTLGSRGFKLDMVNDEPVAYLVGAIVRKALKK